MADDQVTLSPIIRVADVAKLLDVSPGLIYACVKDGTIPALRIGRALRFSRDAILSWMNRQNGEAGATTPAITTTGATPMREGQAADVTRPKPQPQ
jgi:excisionase family DNA binding protein